MLEIHKMKSKIALMEFQHTYDGKFSYLLPTHTHTHSHMQLISFIKQEKEEKAENEKSFCKIIQESEE